MTTLAIIAVSLAVGTWWGIRWAEAKQRIEQTLQQVIMSTPIDDRMTAELMEAIERDRWRWN